MKHFSERCAARGGNQKGMDLTVGAISKRISGFCNQIKQLYRNSFVNRLADRVADAIAAGVGKSHIAAFLTHYDMKKETVHSGFFYRWLVEKPMTYYRRARQFCMSAYERSVLAGFLQKTSDYIFSTSVHSYALGMVLGGVISLTIWTTLFFAGMEKTFFNFSALYGAGLILIGLMLIFCNDSLSKTLYDSKFCNGFLVNIAATRREWFRRTEQAESRYALPLLLGLGLGLAVIFLPMTYLFLGAAGILAFALVMKTPELGVLGAVVLLPFAPTMVLVGLCGLTFAAYLGKLLRGKRTIHFQPLDLWVLAFCGVMLYGGFNSFKPAASLKSALVYLCFISLYFVIANTMCSKKWAKKLVYGFFISGTLASLYGIFQFVSGSAAKSVIWVDTAMFQDISVRVFGSFGNPNVYGEFLVMLLPLSAVMLARTSGWQKVFSLISFLSCGLSLVLTMSRGAWLAMILSFGLFLIVYNRNFLKLAFYGVFAIPFLPAVLPASIVSRFLSIGNMADTSTSYRVSIWMGSLKLLKDFWASGIGLGSEAFMYVYPKYALSAAAYAQHSHNLFLNLFIQTGIFGFAVFILMVIYFFKLVFSAYGKVRNKTAAGLVLALGAGILGILIQGMTDNVWYNYRIFLLFFVFFGMAGALQRAFHEDSGEDFD